MPVVVNPDMVSKNASASFSGVSQSINGIMPNSENTTHTKAVSRNPSRLAIDVCEGFMQKVITTPANKVEAMVMRNAT
jgi:hypothetical protein